MPRKSTNISTFHAIKSLFGAHEFNFIVLFSDGSA